MGNLEIGGKEVEMERICEEEHVPQSVIRLFIGDDGIRSRLI